MLADMLPRVARPARTAILAVAVVTLAATTAAAGCDPTGEAPRLRDECEDGRE